MNISMRSLMAAVWCSVLVLSFSVGSVLSQSKNAQPRIESPADRMSNRIENLVREVRHELVMLPYYSVFDWLEGEVRPDGTVVLRGEVVRPTLKSDAENRVKKIESVSTVINEIRVLPFSTVDDELRRAIYRAIFQDDSPLLMRYGLQSVPPIHIIVENGRATLKGVVATEMDKQLAFMAARGVPGVVDVENELKVETPASN
jgi:hyperosmotically inducible periplasmic protein